MDHWKWRKKPYFCLAGPWSLCCVLSREQELQSRCSWEFCTIALTGPSDNMISFLRRYIILLLNIYGEKSETNFVGINAAQSITLPPHSSHTHTYMCVRVCVRRQLIRACVRVCVTLTGTRKWCVIRRSSEIGTNASLSLNTCTTITIN